MNAIVEEYAELEPRMIVQVKPEVARASFGGCLVVVREVKSWGIEGYILEMGHNVNGVVSVRVLFGQFERTGGRVIWDYSETAPAGDPAGPGLPLPGNSVRG